MTVALTLVGSAVVSLVVALVTSRLAWRRESGGRGVAARRTAGTDVQQDVVDLRDARNRYGTALSDAVDRNEPARATRLDARRVPGEDDVFTAKTRLDAALARLDARDAVLASAVTRWNAVSFEQSMSA